MKRSIVTFGVAILAAVGQVRAFGDDAKPATPTFQFYGFVLPTIIGASGAVESFSQPNLSAFTAAGNPALAKLPNDLRSSFQVAQSRFGFVASPAESTKATIEMDFIDFTKSSPTTAALPRLRRAFVDYKYSEHLLFRIGQDWDLVSPLAPHTFNLVGHYFESGDIGFMRIQAQTIYTDGPWEHALSLGLAGNNNTSSDSGLEIEHLPSVAVRETYRFSDKARVGVSLFAASILPKAAPGVEKLFSGTATAFFETPIGEDTELRTEAYLGQNLNNVAMLGLSFGSATAAAVREAGAYVTVRTKLSPHTAIFGGVGGAWLLDPSLVAPSYATIAGEVKVAGTGPGILSNWTARVGAEVTVNDKLKFFAEAASLSTTHALAPADQALYDSHRFAFVGQLGTMISF